MIDSESCLETGVRPWVVKLLICGAVAPGLEGIDVDFGGFGLFGFFSGCAGDTLASECNVSICWRCAVAVEDGALSEVRYVIHGVGVSHRMTYHQCLIAVRQT